MICKNGVGVLTFLQGAVVKQTLSAGSEVLAKGIYDPTTLSAVDADLAVGNIKKDVNIFGKVGTLAPIVTQRIELLSPPGLGNETSWFTEMEVSIPDTALLVIAVQNLAPAGASCYARMLYNSVQKGSLSSPDSGKPWIIEWAGDGIGSTADLEFQYYRSAGFSYYYNGVAYSVE